MRSAKRRIQADLLFDAATTNMQGAIKIEGMAVRIDDQKGPVPESFAISLTR